MSPGMLRRDISCRFIIIICYYYMRPLSSRRPITGSRRTRHLATRLFRYRLYRHGISAFSALKLLVGRQEEHPASKNWVMKCWCDCDYLSGARCRLFAHGPADATAIPKPYNLLPPLNSDWFYLPGTGLPAKILEKRSLNGCSSSSSSFYSRKIHFPGTTF